MTRWIANGMSMTSPDLEQPRRLAVAWSDQPTPTQGHTFNSATALTAMKTRVYHDAMHKLARDAGPSVMSYLPSFLPKPTDGDTLGKIFTLLGVPKAQLREALKAYAGTYVSQVEETLRQRGLAAVWADFSSAKIPDFLSTASTPDELRQDTLAWSKVCDEIQSVCSNVLAGFVERTEMEQRGAAQEWVAVYDTMAPPNLPEDQLRSALTAFAQFRVGHSAVEYNPYAKYKTDK